VGDFIGQNLINNKMKIKAKGLSAEVEIELPDEKEILAYRGTTLNSIIDKVKSSVIEIETKLMELNKVEPK